MSTLAYALTTKEKVKAYLEITDASKDTIIETLIDQVTDFIEGYCGGRRFLKSTYTQLFDTKQGMSKLFLNNFPIATITSVKYRTGTVSTPIWNTYDANGYYIYEAEGYIQFTASLPAVPKGIQVIYEAGYLIDWSADRSSTHTLPRDLTGLATEMVAGAITKQKSQGVSMMSTEGQSVTFSKNMTDDQKTILGRYQTYRMGI